MHLWRLLDIFTIKMADFFFKLEVMMNLHILLDPAKNFWKCPNNGVFKNELSKVGGLI